MTQGFPQSHHQFNIALEFLARTINSFSSVAGYKINYKNQYPLCTPTMSRKRKNNIGGKSIYNSLKKIKYLGINN
jgi:hypothetical protein